MQSLVTARAFEGIARHPQHLSLAFLLHVEGRAREVRLEHGRTVVALAHARRDETRDRLARTERRVVGGEAAVAGAEVEDGPRIRPAVRGEAHHLAEPFFRAVGEHRPGHDGVELADAPVVAALQQLEPVAASVVQRLRLEVAAHAVDDQHRRLVVAAREERSRRVRIVMIEDEDAFVREVQLELQVVVLELSVGRPAVVPARQTRIVGHDPVHVLQPPQPHFPQAVVDAAQRKRVGVLEAREPILADGHVPQLAARAGDFDQRRRRLVVGEIRHAQDVNRVAGHGWTNAEAGRWATNRAGAGIRASYPSVHGAGEEGTIGRRWILRFAHSDHATTGCSSSVRASRSSARG